MKADFWVRKFDRAVLAVLSARRRRRRAAEMARIEAALEDLEPIPPHEAPRPRATLAPARRRIPGGRDSSRRSARRRAKRIAGATALVGLCFATFVIPPSPPPPEAMALDGVPSGVVDHEPNPTDPRLPGASEYETPERAGEEVLRAERQVARHPEAEDMAYLVGTKDPGRSRYLLRSLEAAYEGEANDPGWGTADCGLAQERAMDAGRELMYGDGGIS